MYKNLGLHPRVWYSESTINMMDDEEALKESVSNLKSAILLGRTDIVRSILSTAANCKSTIDCFEVLLFFL